MKFLTQLNSGCVDICKNMLTSAKQVGLDLDDFIIACLDHGAYEELKEYKGAFLYKDQEYITYQNWSFDEKSDFRKIVKGKWKLITETYTKHPKLCWVDTDIVFVKNPLSYIENSPKILFQCDRPGSLICSGFMVFNDSSRCQEMINELGTNEVEDDQILVNNVVEKYADCCSLLNIPEFPNGHMYYSQGIKNNAVIVHNNHMVGIETKIDKFKNEGLWHL